MLSLGDQRARLSPQASLLPSVIAQTWREATGGRRRNCGGGRGGQEGNE